MAANRTQVMNDLKHILVNELFIDIPADEIKESDRLSSDVGLDSVGLIELVTIVEDKYKITVEEQEEGNPAPTIGSFTDYIVKKAG